MLAIHPVWVGPEGQGCCQRDHWEVGPGPFGSLLLVRAPWERQACQDQSLACVKVITTVRKMGGVFMIDEVEYLPG